MSNRILVVGGASGIGLSTVKELIKANESVYIIDLNPPPTEVISDIIGYYQLDILNSEHVVEFNKKLKYEQEFEHLIITAGGATSTEINAIKERVPFWQLSKQCILDVIALNMLAQIDFLNIFINQQIRSLKSIVLTSSINSSGRYGLPYYSTAKAGIEGFTKAAAEDLGSLGIRINCVVPGSTETPRTVKEGMDFNSVKEQTVLHRVNHPEDIAQAIIFLMRSCAITGQCLVVDSGQMLKSIKRY